MSTLQVSNLHLESTGNTRIQYSGSNGFVLVGNGSNVAVINSTTIYFPLNFAVDTITTNNVTINKTINGVDMILSGNLIVSGNMTYVNTNTLNVGDNIITLNADLPSITAPSENAGVEINRGSSANVLVRWNETNDIWQLTADGTNYYNLITAANTANATVAGITTIVDSVINTSNSTAAAANSVKNAYDRAIDANTRAFSAQSAAASAYSNAIAFSGNAVQAYTNAINWSGNAVQAYTNAINWSGNAAAAYTNATTFASNATNLTTGTIPYDRIPANIVNTTANFTLSNLSISNSLSVGNNFVVPSNIGNVAIGATIPLTDTRMVVNTYWTADDTTYNFRVYSRDNNTALTALRTRYGLFSELNNRSQNKNVDGVTIYSGNYRAIVGDATNGSTTAGGDAFASELVGGNFRSYNYANGANANTVATSIGAKNQVWQFGTGTISSAQALQATVSTGNNSVTGNITTAIGVYSAVTSNTLGIVNTGHLFYGEHFGANTNNKWGIYLNNETKNYFSGNVGIGNTSPVDKLSIKGTVFVSGNASFLANLYFNNGAQYIYSNTTDSYFSGTSWNALYSQNTYAVGGNTAAQLRSYSDTTAATAYSNATNVLAPKASPVFTGTLTAADVVISGNLTVSGGTTYVNTTTLNIGDNIITLNADLPGGSSPTENAGVEINRGNAANVQIRWNETSDVWQSTSDGTNYYNLITSANTANATVAGVTTVLDSVVNTSVLIAASANSVKNAYDRAIDANTRASSAQTAAAAAYSNAIAFSGNAALAYSNAIAWSGNAALAYANAVSVASSDATSKASTAYSNAIGWSGNAALAYSNAIAWSGNAALAYANAMATTLSRNGTYTGNNIFNGSNTVVNAVFRVTNSTSNIFFIGSNGNIGVGGNTTPINDLRVDGTISSGNLQLDSRLGIGTAPISTAIIKAVNDITLDSTYTAMDLYTGIQNTAVSAARAYYGYNLNLYNYSQNKAANGVFQDSDLIGVNSVVINGPSAGNAQINDLMGYQCDVRNSANGSAANTVDIAYGLNSIVRTFNSGNITTAYGLRTVVGPATANSSVTGGFTTAYGVYATLGLNTANSTIGTGYVFYGSCANNITSGSAYGLYLSGTDKNYISGNVGINSGTYTHGLYVAGTGHFTGAITSNGDITAYSTSDITLKSNVAPISFSLGKVRAIRGVTFDWVPEEIERRGGEDGYLVRKHDVGVIAQEIEKVLPEAVGTRENGIKAVRYELIVPLLIEAIKELSDKVEELEKKINGVI